MAVVLEPRASGDVESKKSLRQFTYSHVSLGAVFLTDYELQMVELNLAHAERRLSFASVFSAKGAAVSVSLGHRPRIHATKKGQR
jgi:hypothetical protein